jgi:hypothetical protein
MKNISIAKYKYLHIFLLLFVTQHIGGCVGFSRNVSHVTEWWGGYEYNKEYVLLRDVFLLTDNTKKYFLVPEHSMPRFGGIKVAPESIKEYNSNPNKVGYSFEQYWKDTSGSKVIGVVDAGTKIKCILLEKYSGFSIWFGFGGGLDIYGQIINGPFSNHKVDMRDVSIYFYYSPDRKDDPILFKPDPNLLN